MQTQIQPMPEEQRHPRLLPVTIAMSLLFWIITTTGGRQIFVKEVLGEAYDSQAEYLLRGDAGVDVEAIRPEAMIVDGQVRMYFGPFPALLRIPLNLLYPAGRGMWSRFSGFCAGVMALFAFAGLAGDSLRSSLLSARARNWVGNACVVGFAFGSPLLFLLGNLSIYNEAVVWGFAWSVAALFFACRCRSAQGPRANRMFAWVFGVRGRSITFASNLWHLFASHRSSSRPAPATRSPPISPERAPYSNWRGPGISLFAELREVPHVTGHQFRLLHQSGSQGIRTQIRNA